MKFFKVILAAALCYAAPLAAADAGCAKVDPNVKDPDGMPLCPDVVKQTSAFAVYRCALDQFRAWHEPTAPEKAASKDLLQAFRQSTVLGPKPETTAAIMKAADQMGAQACRVKDVSDGKPDSYLLVFTKYGVTNYSGAFLMLRETNASKVVIVSPHDDSDFTHSDTKIALQKSRALAVISNGHRRGGGSKEEQRKTDFVHSKDNLAWFTVNQFGDLFPGSVWIHVHGMQDPDTILYRPQGTKASDAYEKAMRKATGITNYKGLNAAFTIDPPVVNSGFYVKTEIPVKIHSNRPGALAAMVRELETYDWAWPQEGKD